MSPRLNRDRRDIRYALSTGWRFDGPTKRGHLRFTHPQTTDVLVLCSKTGDWRAEKNAIAWLKRHNPRRTGTSRGLT